jgi:hypothetical protein
MSLYQDGKVDMLALCGGRELDHFPWHFTKIKLDNAIHSKEARAWIWKNFNGRFTLSSQIIFVHQYYDEGRYVGFEDPSEATAFMLSQPLLITDGVNW